MQTGEQDDRALVAEAVHVLGAERARAGADLTLADDPVSMLAYGLGARPAGADLTSLEDLLRDLGLSEEGDELRTHFDDVLAQTDATSLHLRNDAERSMFRDLAGASFVLGAAARILELASLTSTRHTIPARRSQVDMPGPRAISIANGNPRQALSLAGTRRPTSTLWRAGRAIYLRRSGLAR